MILKTLYSCLLLCFFSCCANEQSNSSPPVAEPLVFTKKDSIISDSIPQGLKRLKAAYPDMNFQVAKNHLIWPDGERMIFDDGIADKSFENLLDSPDLEDQLSILYPEGTQNEPPKRNQDPGRIRYEPFFLKMYGTSKEAVKKKLVPIDFMGATLMVTPINGIDKKLLQIAKTLEQYPDFKKYFEKVGGTFNWRKIAGTNRLSTHSFGMTIDINIKYANYWRWEVSDKTENGKRLIVYKNKIPLEIVKIFEDNGFIWGGKWYHYDTMHFEYRPELLLN